MFVWTFEGVMQAIGLVAVMLFIFLTFIFELIGKIKLWFKKGR